VDTFDFARCRALNVVPTKKLQGFLTSIQESSEPQKTKNIKIIVFNRYAESNLPIEYWGLKMEKNFVGDPRLKQKYEDYIKDIKQSYISGKSICLAGEYGIGKTMAIISILKKAVEKGYSALYTDLSSIISVLTQASSEDKFSARRELTMVDFLAIDEVDQRYFQASNLANETFARTLEFVLRSRTANTLPILMATNSPQITETFTNQFKDSLGSIMSKIEMFMVMPGSDFRKEHR
jgi:DNA replication protein DnaC